MDKLSFNSIFRYLVITGNIVYFLWILRNGISEGFNTSPVMIVSYFGLLILLILNIFIMLNSNKKGIPTALISVLVIILVAATIYFFALTKNKGAVNQLDNQNLNPTASSTTATSTTATSTLEYKNPKYGFTFSLPLSWQGYSIINQNWEGQMIEEGNGQVVKGPEIIIRHPLWTAKNIRQDIPIMIFTPAQWDLIQQEKLSLGAAPIGPSELGRNAQYIFALPARYNFAFPMGFEEVEKIIEASPLKI